MRLIVDPGQLGQAAQSTRAAAETLAGVRASLLPYGLPQTGRGDSSALLGELLARLGRTLWSQAVLLSEQADDLTDAAVTYERTETVCVRPP